MHAVLQAICEETINMLLPFNYVDECLRGVVNRFFVQDNPVVLV